MGRSPQPFLDAGPMAGPQSQLPPRFMAIMEQLPPELAQQIIESYSLVHRGQEQGQWDLWDQGLEDQWDGLRSSEKPCVCL